MAHRVRFTKWVLLVLVVVVAASQLVSKGVQVFFMSQNGWDVSSFSPISTIVIFVGALAFLLLEVFDIALRKGKATFSTWAIVILASISLLYAGFIGILQLRSLVI